MLEICKDRSISPDIVVRPEQHREHRQASARATVLRLMALRGVTVKNINEVCPLTESAIRKSLENGREQ